MKLSRSIFIAAIPILFLPIYTQGALAATTSAATVQFNADPVGALSLDSVSDLGFGAQDSSLTDKIYESTNLTPGVQVTDERSINNATGWHVTVSASPFTSTPSASTLNGATINFSNGDSTSSLNYIKPTTAPFVLTTDGVTGTVTVVSAQTGEGRGTWNTSWLPTQGTPVTNDSVTLHVPGGIMVPEAYTSTLTWTLLDTP
ncbi:WxL domain-containing protein [Ectobacillus sp. sgz5001026]|uniref:WxL domain-containing protein n=1 Tax=Ectobacillus sp. sgz5001026 TaxID=3242473 RepID=UPI0036D2619C